MNYFIFIILLGVCSAHSEFNYNILTQPPFSLTEPCSPTPCKSGDNENDNYCPLKNETTGAWNLVVAVSLPNTSFYITNLDSAKEMLQLSVQENRDNGFLPDKVNVSVFYMDDGCTPGKSSGNIVDAMRLSCLHLIIGPSCDYVTATVGRTAQYIKKPVLSPTALSRDFTNNKTQVNQEFYFTINPGKADFRTYSEFILLIAHRYNFTKVVFMYERYEQNEVGGEDSCYLTVSSIISELQAIGVDYVDGDLMLLGLNYTEFLINKIGVNYGIIVTCTGKEGIRRIAIEAAKLNMMDRGEYTFFNIETYNNATYPDQPWYSDNDTEENNALAKKGYQGIYTLLPLEETDFHAVNKQKRRGSIWLDGIYDAMNMYIQALNNYTDNFSESSINSCVMLNRMMAHEYKGRYNKSIQMNCNGVRTREVAFVHLNSNGQYEVMGKYTTSNKTVYYWNVDWTLGIPSDTPQCGYDLSKCPKINLIKLLTISLIVVVVLAAIIVGYIFYRHIRIKREIEKKVWRVSQNDIIFTPSKPRASIHSAISARTEVDNYSLAGDRQMYTKVGIFRGNAVAVKYLQNIKIELTRDNLYELTAIKDLSHDNLVKFHGACLDIPNFILNEYCSRGSLQDTLENESVKLDWMFRISLIMDLVRGMHYLHNRTQIKCHGALKSPNCLVDSRFKLKIADFGLSFLRPYTNEENFNKNSHSYYQRQLWTAPELLNQDSLSVEGSQKGDIYSFGIILHEIIMRKGVFYLGDYDIDTQRIVETVRKGPEANNGKPLRPLLGPEALCENDEVEQLMRKCWAENSVDRPDFTTLKNKLHQLNKKENDGNLLDNLLARMEQYANNLETLVDERTHDYLEEKKKCEQVLYQLLPKSVAEQLIRRESVNAETFDSVTIYFSDIVGFTELSAQSTPLQVVDLLNDLYTCFDSIVEEFDVYKVETIGDAYMVVSGLPKRNGNSHAREIARMSLHLLKDVKKFQIRHKPEAKLKLRIGIHTGPCVAGVVGLKMPRYCLFGDTVNTASRMESCGEAFRIHVSSVTKEVLDTFGTFDLESRGPIEIKGKGIMTTYWLNSERDSKKTTQPGPSWEEKFNKLPVTPVSHLRREMGRRALNDSNTLKTDVIPDESGIPLLTVISSDTDSHA